MKYLIKFFFFSVFLLHYFYVESQESNIYVRISEEELSIEQFIQKVETQTNYKVYSNSKDILSINVFFESDSIDVFSFLEKQMNINGFYANFLNDEIYLTTSPIVFAKLSEVILDKTIENLPISDEDFTITDSEQRYIMGRSASTKGLIVVGSSNGHQIISRATLSGILKDEITGERLIGATVYVEELEVGAATNENGFFKLDVESGLYNVRFDCMGQETANYHINILSDGEISISLPSSIISIDELRVYGDRSKSVMTRDAGFERIPMNIIKELPMMMGERDVIRVTELLPGVVSIGEGTSGINVRGGNFDQNGFYINKVPIFNTSHVFGFFPAFNPDVVKDLSVYKGHMPVEHGGHISSVFNIKTKQGNRKNFNVRGGLNPVTSNLTLEGPIIRDVGSALLSLRSTYSNWILRQIPDPDIRNSSAKFHDIIFTSSFDLNKNNSLNLFTYQSSDFFKLSDINQYEYSNLGGSLDWKRILSQSTWTDLSLIFSQYSFETIDNNIEQLAYQHEYRISKYEFQSKITHILNHKTRLDLGLVLVGYNLKKGNVDPYENSVRVPINLGEEKGFESAIFIADTYNPFSWLNLYIGIRYSAFAPLGGRDVYNYTNGQPFELIHIRDTVSYNKFQPIEWYHGPEIRASANFLTDANGSIKLSYNQTRQNLFMLNNTITISPNTQWQLANEHLKPLLGKQLSIGVFREMPRIYSEFSVEFFGKQVDNVSEFKDGASFVDTKHIETMMLQGEQVAYGFEVMLRKSGGRLNGWVGYTYSRSIVEVAGSETWMQINEGIAYPSNYDVPHAVNFVFNYRFSRRVNFSTTATYQQGRPITYPISVYYLNDLPVIDYSSRNEYRVPDYFRLDMSLAVEGNLKKRKLFHSSWVFGVYNATGRNNPLSIYFKQEDGRINGYKYSVIGAPIYTVTWVFKLGNYATD